MNTMAKILATAASVILLIASAALIVLAALAMTPWFPASTMLDESVLVSFGLFLAGAAIGWLGRELFWRGTGHDLPFIDEFI